MVFRVFKFQELDANSAKKTRLDVFEISTNSKN
jgi:hypothetical protein